MVDEPAVDIDRVSVRRADAQLLRDVDWRVAAGERWVVLGGNGAGKTTLMQVVAGLLRPTTGRVCLLGEDLADADLDELLPRVGWASAALADELPRDERAVDVVLTATYASLRRGREPYDALDEGRARQLLAQLGCRALTGRLFGSLSEGERKRVQLARALMADPELLIMDEPAAGLDLGGREALVRRLSRFAARADAPTMLLVTHHVEEIPAGFTHALLLRGGQLLDAGPMGDVLTESGLSACFGLPVRLLYRDGRYAAHARI